MLALHPDYLAERSDPKEYLDDLRRRMDKVSAQSLEIGDTYLKNAQRKLEAESIEPRRPVSHEPEQGTEGL